jgi:hypothetical protein
VCVWRVRVCVCGCMYDDVGVCVRRGERRRGGEGYMVH